MHIINWGLKFTCAINWKDLQIKKHDPTIKQTNDLKDKPAGRSTELWDGEMYRLATLPKTL